MCMKSRTIGARNMTQMDHSSITMSTFGKNQQSLAPVKERKGLEVNMAILNVHLLCCMSTHEEVKSMSSVFIPQGYHHR